MKKSKLFAKVTAVALATLTMFSSMTVAFAEDSTVTDKPNIYMDIENEVGEKKMSEDDAKIFAEAMNYYRFDGGVTICSEETSFDINWEKSEIHMNEVYDVEIVAPRLLRDEEGKLVVSSANIFPCDDYGWVNGQYVFIDDGAFYAESILEHFDITGKRPEITDYDYSYCSEPWINDNIGRIVLKYKREILGGIVEEEEISDIYIIRICYTTDGLGNRYTSDTPWNERKFGWTDFLILPEGVDTVLNLEDIEEDTSKDDETVDNYVVDLTSGNMAVSASDFSAILTENATKDVVIKSNNNVTFTFAKGTMKAVDGMTNYDFTTTINNTYKSDLPSYVTKDNFVSIVDYNYSGKLPAEASIKIPVGTEYAGKTLYYSLMNEDKTFAEVQAVNVDAEGYITVKQDHCSSYVITNTEPKLDTNTEQPTTNNNTEQPTTNNNTEQPTTNNSTEQPTPNTRDNTTILLFIGVGMVAIVAVVVARKFKTA